MKAVFRLSLGLCVLNLILVGGCKKQKNKKLVQYRSTDFISSNMNYSQKKVVEKAEDKEQEEKEKTPETKNPEDNKNIPPTNPTATNTPVPSKSPSFGAWDTDDKAKGENGKAQGNKAAGSSSPKGDSSAAVIAANAGTVPGQSFFDQEVGSLVSCGQSFKSQQKNVDWPSCFQRSWKEGTAKLFCGPSMTSSQSAAILNQQTAALDRAANIVNLADYLKSFADINEHKKILEEVPCKVAAKVSAKILESDEKYILPKGVKEPLGKILEKYKALKDYQKNQASTEAGKFLDDYNKLDISQSIADINKVFPDLFNLTDYQDLKLSPDDSFADRLAWGQIQITREQAAKDTLAKLEGNLTNLLKKVSENVSDTQVKNFLDAEPQKVVQQSIELTGWPFTYDMKLNVYDLVIDQQASSEEKQFRERLYDEVYKYYQQDGRNTDAMRNEAYNFFKTKENINAKNTELAELPKKIGVIAKKLGADRSVVAWQNDLCKKLKIDAVSEANSGTNNSCNFTQILVEGANQPDLLKQQAVLLVAQTFQTPELSNTLPSFSELNELIKEAKGEIFKLAQASPRQNTTFCQSLDTSGVAAPGGAVQINQVNRATSDEQKPRSAPPAGQAPAQGVGIERGGGTFNRGIPPGVPAH